MSGASHCPLGPALLRLLQASVDNNTTDAKSLAALLSLSPDTVRLEFQRIFAAIGVDNRAGALTVAIRKGWVTVKPDIPAAFESLTLDVNTNE